MTIPLCIDYILEKELCERDSLAAFLQLDDNLISKALNRLNDHGILESDKMKRGHFEELYADKLGLTKTKIVPNTQH